MYGLCKKCDLPALHESVLCNACEAARLKNVLEQFSSYVLTCRKKNTNDWMEGLVDEINDVSEALGETIIKRFTFEGDGIISRRM